MRTNLTSILLLYAVLCFQGRTPMDVTFYDNTSYEPAYHIEIEIQEVYQEETADDGTVCFTLSYSYPIVSIAGNNSAAENINTDIHSRIDEWLTTINNSGNVEWAKKQYAAGELYEPYYETLSISDIQRADDNIISFTMDYSGFAGGMHPWSEVHGINYDAKTGILLTLSDLGESSASFCTNFNNYNQEAAKTVSYKDLMLKEDDADHWFLSASGLTCIINERFIIEWTIPYCVLSDMGYKDEYAYYGRQMLRLEEDQIYSIDLNGDSSKDSVLFYDEYIEREDHGHDYVTHLIINGVDYTEEYLSQYLCDLDRTDSYVEIMRTSIEREEDGFVYYSHFYRFMEDGTLTYLGKVKGNAGDPTVDTSQLIVSIE